MLWFAYALFGTPRLAHLDTLSGPAGQQGSVRNPLGLRCLECNGLESKHSLMITVSLLYILHKYCNSFDACITYLQLTNIKISFDNSNIGQIKVPINILWLPVTVVVYIQMLLWCHLLIQLRRRAWQTRCTTCPDKHDEEFRTQHYNLNFNQITSKCQVIFVTAALFVILGNSTMYFLAY